MGVEKLKAKKVKNHSSNWCHLRATGAGPDLAVFFPQAAPSWPLVCTPQGARASPATEAAPAGSLTPVTKPTAPSCQSQEHRWWWGVELGCKSKVLSWCPPACLLAAVCATGRVCVGGRDRGSLGAEKGRDRQQQSSPGRAAASATGVAGASAGCQTAEESIYLFTEEESHSTPACQDAPFGNHNYSSLCCSPQRAQTASAHTFLQPLEQKLKWSHLPSTPCCCMCSPATSHFYSGSKELRWRVSARTGSGKALEEGQLIIPPDKSHNWPPWRPVLPTSWSIRISEELGSVY